MVGNQREADLRTLLIHEKETWENWREEKKKHTICYFDFKLKSNNQTDCSN
jgi:hypothetical protein